MLKDRNVPRITQTAYRSGGSCRNWIFAVERKFTNEGDTVYSRFLDLASAFDTVEFCVLLEQLFKAGMLEVDSRLVLQCLQQGEGHSLLVPFNFERGIRQGSVLSPTLFNLVISSTKRKISGSEY